MMMKMYNGRKRVLTHQDADKPVTPRGTAKQHSIQKNSLIPETGHLQCRENRPHPAGKMLNLSFSPWGRTST
jgi:hypothetical protein